jgi:hypothetical protein
MLYTDVRSRTLEKHVRSPIYEPTSAVNCITNIVILKAINKFLCKMLNIKCGDDNVTERGGVVCLRLNVGRKCTQESRLRALENFEYRMSKIICLGYDVGCRFRHIKVLMSLEFSIHQNI